MSLYRIAVALALVAGCSTCGGASQGGPAAPKPAFRLAVITDLQGYLEPCGCTSRPLGGIDRLAAQIRALRADGVPLLFVAAGDLLFGAAHGGPLTGDLAAKAHEQERWKAEALVGILNDLAIDAVAYGPLDTGRGPELRTLESSARFANVGDYVTRKLGPHTLGIFGVNSNDQMTAAMQAQGAVTAMTTEGVGLTVALSSTRRSDARGADTPGVTFVVQGGADTDKVEPPARGEHATILHASRQGRGLLVVDVHATAGQPLTSLTDRSAWTRDAERARLDARITDLEKRIAQWEADPNINRADLEQQKRELVQIKAQRAAVSIPPVTGPWFEARFVELTRESPKDENVTRLMSAYDRRVNEHNRVAFADWAPPPAPESAASYVGSATCGTATCHAPALAWWRGHPHGIAYSTLQNLNKEFNLSCVGCHVTGYGRAGGSTVTHNLDGALVNVGCESCHGAGSQHVANPETAPLAANVPETTCIGCHNHEHSDLFNYSTYRAMLRAPGHGMPTTAGR